MRLTQGEHWCVSVHVVELHAIAGVFLCIYMAGMCVPVRHRVPALIARLLLKAVTGVNLMRGEGKARSADRHRRDHSLQCT